MTTQDMLWSLCAAAAAMAVTAALAERRRNARADLDRPGWMPWPALQVLAMIAAVVAAVLALKAG
jgi:hypothetical protein